MKAFFTSFFGALVGVLLAGIICTVIFASIVSGSINSIFAEQDEAPVVKENSILRIDFKGGIPERSSQNPFANFKISGLGQEPPSGLNDILANLKKAKTDDKIKGIYLNLTGVEAGIATIEEVRNALLDFKKSNKFIYAYSEMYDQKSYYLSSVADKIYCNPQGEMSLKGLSAQIMFYKNTLEKLEVEMQIFRHGKFKSAIEPYILDKMSEANRMQSEAFMGSIWNTMLTGISEQRKISVADLNAIADGLKVRNTADAVSLKLIDELKYEDEVMDIMKKKLGVADKEKLSFVDFSKYTNHIVHTKSKKEEKTEAKKEEKIAVIYAVGQIESGEGDDETIGSDRIAKAIKEARMDSSIKAIVLRVNSPGGSALASDVMWREVTLAKKVKPVIVSMGDVAASGGYYISCAADRIFAQPNTITGSIGVFGMMPNAQKMLQNKLGIMIDTVNTNKHSDFGTTFRAVTEDERAIVQQSVENVYDVFIGRVAEGRKITKAEVDSIGQGRVWSGTDALKIKLVDELGGLDNAIAYAAKMAKVANYKTIAYPKQENPLDKIFNKKTEDAEAQIAKKALGKNYAYVKYFQSIMNLKGVQARLPFDLVIE